MFIPGRTWTTSIALPNALAEDGRYCNVGNWFPSGSSIAVRVRCFTASGTPADTPFTAAYFDGTVGSP